MHDGDWKRRARRMGGNASGKLRHKVQKSAAGFSLDFLKGGCWGTTSLARSRKLLVLPVITRGEASYQKGKGWRNNSLFDD